MDGNDSDYDPKKEAKREVTEEPLCLLRCHSENSLTLYTGGGVKAQSRVVVNTLVPALELQRQVDLWGFGSSLVYLESSRPARTTQ